MALDSLISTLAGFAGWGFLLRRYASTTVAPFSMLVPFFGMASAALFLGEQIHTVDVLGGAFVVGGILLGLKPATQPAPALVAAPSKAIG